MAGRIAESTLREIRDRADIVEVVSETVPLSRSGASFRGLCPFHREKTPSFFVHPSKQIFHCFGCGEGGSVFHYLMKIRNLSFAEAVEDLGSRYGILVQYERGGAPSRPREDLLEILRIAAGAFREMLRSSPSGKPALDLLRKRGVTPEAEQEFSLGFGGDGNELTKRLSEADLDKAVQAGLLVPRERGGYRERFRGRVIFPVADARGRICGFGGRAIGDAVPKYLNSPESPVYRKSSLLYGLHHALPAIRKEGAVIVVEGYMDLIALWQQGIRNVVATCGTSLADGHARTLKRMSEAVILLFDGDVAGKRSAVRAGGPLYAAGVSPMVVFPPKGMDPDDWAKAVPGPELAEKIGRAVPLMESIERSAARKYDLTQIAGKLSYLKLMGTYLRWVTDPAEQRLYVQRVARSAGLPEDTVLQRIRGTRKPEGADAPPRGIPPREKGTHPEEDLLMALLFRDPGLAAEIRRDGVEELLEGNEVREVVARLCDRAEAGEEADLRDLLDEETRTGVRGRLSERILRAEIPAEEARRIYPEVVLGLRIRKARRELDRLKKEIGLAGEERARELFSRMVGVRNELERLARERGTSGRRDAE